MGMGRYFNYYLRAFYVVGPLLLVTIPIDLGETPYVWVGPKEYSFPKWMRGAQHYD